MKAAKSILTAAMLPLMFACAKENVVEEKPNGNTEKAEYDFTVVASEEKQPQETLSKASFDDENGVVWVAGGQAGIVADGGSAVGSESLANISEDGYSASFSFTASEGTYRLFYPYSAESNYNNYRFEVSAEQESAPGKSSDIFALVGTEDLELSANAKVADAKMKVVGSYIFFQVYGKAGETVKSIEIASKNTKVGGVYYAKNEGSLVGTPEGNSDVKVTLSSDYITTEGKGEAKGIYAAVLPVKSQNTYTVTTDKGTYTFTSRAEKEFKMGSIKPIPLNLNAGTFKYANAPEHLYLIGDATSIGWNNQAPIEMTSTDGGMTFTCTDILQTGSARSGFKFLTEKGSWSNVYVKGEDNKLNFYEGIPSTDKDVKFTVDKAGKYRITANFETMEVTTELVPEYPEVLYQFENGTAKYIDVMKQTGNGYSARIFVASGDGNHDFKIRKGDKYYHVGNDYPKINFNNKGNIDVLSREYDVVYDENPALGWWIDDIYSNKYYDITLNAEKVSVKLSQETEFWLIGINGDWNSFNSAYKAIADGSGVAKWDIEVKSVCDFKINGKNMTNDFFGEGEWYQSWSDIVESGFLWEWKDGEYGKEVPVLFGKSGDYNRKWKMTETGNFTIVFDTRNLTIKVTKNN